jgi:sterol desaturase/sphingolipid hydroxylase (fatty acid hydroxylase superfamily)
MSDEATLRARKSIRNALVLAGVQIAGALLLTLANKAGWIDSETTTRGVMVLIGLMLVVIGNALPKQQDGPPAQTVSEAVVRQSITRVGGWALLLGGIIWTVLWAIAPRDVAQVGSIAAVATASAIMIAYAIWRYTAHRRSSAS